jgi:hypothetical protein
MEIYETRESVAANDPHKTGCCKRCYFECTDPDMGFVTDCLFFDCACHDSGNPWADIIKVATHHKITDLSGGWTMAESGPCCDKCSLKPDEKYGNMTRLCGCTNPFQLNESGNRKLCQCHITHREKIQKRVNEALDRVIKFAQSHIA